MGKKFDDLVKIAKKPGNFVEISKTDLQDLLDDREKMRLALDYYDKGWPGVRIASDTLKKLAVK